MTKRMTTEQLEAIRKRAEAASKFRTVAYPHWYEKKTYEKVCEDIPALLAEVERLQKGNAMYEWAIAEDDATKERLITKLDEAISICLWTARRLPRASKPYAYDYIDELTGEKSERV